MAWSKALALSHNGTTSDYITNIVDPVYNLLDTNSSALTITKQVQDANNVWYFFSMAVTSPFGESFTHNWAELYFTSSYTKRWYEWDGLSADYTTVGTNIYSDTSFNGMYQSHVIEIYTSDSGSNAMLGIDTSGYTSIFWPGDDGWLFDWNLDSTRPRYTPLILEDFNSSPYWHIENSSIYQVSCPIETDGNTRYRTRPIYTDVVTYGARSYGVQFVKRMTDALMRLNPKSEYVATNGNAKMIYYDNKYYISLSEQDLVIYELGANPPTGGFLTGSMS